MHIMLAKIEYRGEEYAEVVFTASNVKQKPSILNLSVWIPRNDSVEVMKAAAASVAKEFLERVLSNIDSNLTLGPSA